MTPYYSDDHVTIYHGDCLELIDELAFDVIVTDPPYGIDGGIRPQPGAQQFQGITGDDSAATAEAFMSRISPDMPAVIFGANCFPHALPHRGRWICWDKRLTVDADRMLGSAFELAWTNRRSGYDRMIRVLHGGVVNANGHGLARVHPTEKPVTLLRQIIEAEPPGVILDPFMGSGTTLRAAKDLGRKAIGIEIEERYCEIAAKRMGQEVLAL
jgi:tRNA G10  N-methylase Trm11